MQVRSAYAVEGRLLQTSARANMQPVPEDEDDAPLVNINSHGARPVDLGILTMLSIRTSRLSIKNSLSVGCRV